MKWVRVSGRLSLLVVVLFLSYYLGLPLYWDMQQRLRTQAPFDDSGPASASPPDINHSNQNLLTKDDSSSNFKDEPGKNQGPRGVSTEDAFEVTELGISNQTDASANSVAGSVSSSDRKFPSPLHADLKRPIWEVPAVGSEMPPLEEFALRKEMVEFRAKNNVIAVTFANHAFMGFVLTWVKSLTDNGVTNLLVGAMDTELLEDLYWAGIPTFNMGSNMKTFDVGWGSPSFHKMGREKVILVNAFLALDYELLMCDTDMVWLKNPLPYMERFPNADVLTSSDEVVNSVNDDKLENWKLSAGQYNIGINYWRPTTVGKKFAAEWKEQLLADDRVWDQNGFNELMRKTSGPEVDDESGLFYCYDGTLKLGILPVSIFCSGHTFFVQALHKVLGLQPFAVHTTFQFAGTEGKRHRLREAMVFYDPPDYYDVPGGYLSFTPSLPENLMHGGAHTVETHFALVNHQLVQVRNALAMASILNRTLVMPALWCRFDRMWFGHPGKLPGTHTKQPFLCPMDHIFEINLWLKPWPEDEFGPEIRFREYSFFDNPRFPSKLNASTLKVILCEQETPECNGHPSQVPLPGFVRLPVNSTEDELRTALSPYAEAHVIEFSSMIGAFGGFSDQTRSTLFMNRVKKYTGIWCCVQDHTPGHIWYDIYWDMKPNWKPRPPADAQEDHQPF